MIKRYFSYGTDPEYPYQGGHTVVEAEDPELAERGFRRFHANRPGSPFVNCEGIYSEKNWQTSGMAEDPDCPCREKITVTLEDCDFDEDGFFYQETISYRREVLYAE